MLWDWTKLGQNSWKRVGNWFFPLFSTIFPNYFPSFPEISSHKTPENVNGL